MNLNILTSAASTVQNWANSMDDAERRSAKRSRFDQTEPEPKRQSRFDRRSRSPPSRKSDPARDRSPLSRDRGSSIDNAKASPIDPAVAAGTFVLALPIPEQQPCARNQKNPTRGRPCWLTCLIAAAAAKINAQLQARKAIQHADVPPVRAPASPAKTGGSNSTGTINGEVYIADGDYIKDIEVNDLRNRYLLTKGSTQKMVNLSLANSC